MERRNGLELVTIPAEGAMLPGDLGIPRRASGIVVFAHGSGSSRKSPRNRAVAEDLRQRGLATLLLDLLTPEEESVDNRTAQIRFDIDLLSERLVSVIDWLGKTPETEDLGVALFGASTGAAAALVAAAERHKVVRAVVSRGGRPDLAGDALEHVLAPTLLIVGGADTVVLDINQQAFESLTCEKDLVVVPGATHLFEESGALAEVARLAAEWIVNHVGDEPSSLRAKPLRKKHLNMR